MYDELQVKQIQKINGTANEGSIPKIALKVEEIKKVSCECDSIRANSPYGPKNLSSE